MTDDITLGKDDNMEIISNIFMVMFLWGLFNFTMYVVRVRKTLKKYKDDPNIKGVQIVNGKVHVIEKDKNVFEAEIKEETKELVTDPVCHEELEKANAYHVIRDGQSNYFCSWDCREKFLESVDEKHL